MPHIWIFPGQQAAAPKIYIQKDPTSTPLRDARIASPVSADFKSTADDRS